MIQTYIASVCERIFCEPKSVVRLLISRRAVPGLQRLPNEHFERKHLRIGATTGIWTKVPTCSLDARVHAQKEIVCARLSYLFLVKPIPKRVPFRHHAGSAAKLCLEGARNLAAITLTRYRIGGYWERR